MRCQNLPARFVSVIKAKGFTKRTSWTLSWNTNALFRKRLEQNTSFFDVIAESYYNIPIEQFWRLKFPSNKGQTQVGVRTMFQMDTESGQDNDKMDWDCLKHCAKHSSGEASTFDSK